jgi:hypothetical protein
MKAFVNDAVGLHLPGRYPYKNKEDLAAAFNSADPNGAQNGKSGIMGILAVRLKP